MKRVILRADDICATTDPAALLRVYGPCWARGHPVALSLIPASAYRFTSGGPTPAPPTSIDGHRPLCALLNTLARQGLVEFLLHGWQHRPGEMAEGTAQEIGGRLDAGLTVLRRAFPDARVWVVVPPHEYGSPAGMAAARERALTVCSTWAATHGGRRTAHWWGRMRRWLGRPFAPPRDGRWPTDVDVLAFHSGARRDDAQRTAHLLSLAERWDAPVVFPHHYWRLLDPQGAPNNRYTRWAHWLTRLQGRADVTFVRFCDEDD
jgi:hypothetical protein